MIKNKKMPWSALAIAFAFIFNPNIAIIDPLPDFVGYIIISVALGRLAMLNSTLSDAKKAFETMILVDCGKLLAIFWIFGIDVISEQTTSILVWCFVFAVLEAVFLLPALIKLFNGISELGDFYPSTTIHASIVGKSITRTEKIRNFSCFFVLFKGMMTVLPELSVLSNSSTDEATYANSLYRYIGVMRVLCFIPVAIVGTIWLVNIVKYFFSLSRDDSLNVALSEAYLNKAENWKGLFIKSNVKAACWLLVLSAVLTLDFRFEGINILPDIIMLATLIPSCIYFEAVTSENKNKRNLRTFTLLYAVSSLLSYFFENYYNENFTYNAMNKDAAAFSFYVVSVIAVAFQGVMFICLLSTVFKRIRYVICQHTGYVVGKEIYTDGEQSQIMAVQKELSKNFEQALDVAIFYVISDLLFSLYGAFYAFANVNLGFLNVVNLMCGIFFIFMIQRATGDLKDAVNTKYMLN